MTKRFAPPDPRPWKADEHNRALRKETEKQNPGFGWQPAILLGLIGASILFSVERNLGKHEQKTAEKEERRRREAERGEDRGGRGGRGDSGYAGHGRRRGGGGRRGASW